MKYQLKNLLNKRIVSGVISIAMAFNLTAVLPMSVFAEDSPISNPKEKYFNGNKYQLIDKSMKWDEAKSYCEEKGGHLVVITSEEEQSFIETLLSNGSKSRYWHGAYTNDDTLENWEWVTGEEFEYSNWNDGEPNYPYEHYGHFYKDNGKWNNLEIAGGSGKDSYSYIGLICEWENDTPDQIEEVSPYTIFSGSDSENFQISCWKSRIDGNVYTGKDFIYNGSEFYMSGRVDSVNNITTNGWKTEISERNENIEKADMPDWDAQIHEKAGAYEYSEEDITKIEDKNVIVGSLKTAGKVEISGTTFDGDCYIIADGDITYNVNDFVSTGRVVLYSRNGNITINGTSVDFNGIIYAPNGTVAFNTNIANINGRIFADRINFSGSIFNVSGSDSDWELIGTKTLISKTYILDKDFNEGQFDGLGLDVQDEVTMNKDFILSDKEKTLVYELDIDESVVNVKETLSKDYITSQDNCASVIYDFSSFGEKSEKEHRYELINEQLTWTQAKAYCESRGGHLVTVSDKAEFEIVKGLLNSVDKTHLWMGGYYDSADKKWKWVDSTPFIYTNWDNGEPNRCYRGGQYEQYLMTYKVGNPVSYYSKAYGWNDMFENGVFPGEENFFNLKNYCFVCEWDSVKSYLGDFSVTVNDFSKVDLERINPQPDNITENGDGTAILTWNNVSSTIEIPFNNLNTNVNRVDILKDVKLVVKNDLSSIIKYLDDLVMPVHSYTELGSWTTTYDSKSADTVWKNIYWDGKLHDDSSIVVKACAGNDENSFGEWININNYQDVENLTGRYVKILVEMEISSTGKTPELFDITINSEGAEKPNHVNNAPSAVVNAKDITSVSKKLSLVSEIEDDAYCSKLDIQWTCDDENAFISNANKPYTSVKFSQAGEYEVVLTVSDVNSQTKVVKKVRVIEDDLFITPIIEIEVPSYCKPGETVTGKINLLNSVEVSRYEVTIGDDTYKADENGNFSFKSPDEDGNYAVNVKAETVNGIIGEASENFIVDGTAPNAELKSSSNEVFTGDLVNISAILSDNNGISDYYLALNGEEVTLDENYQYIFKPEIAGSCEFVLKATDIVGNETEAKLVLEILEKTSQDTKQPILHFAYPKMIRLGDEAEVTLYATDDVGVAEFEVTANGETVTFDENNNFKYTPAEVGFMTIDIHAADAAGNVTDYQIKIPVVQIDLATERTTYKEDETVTVKLTYSDNLTIINQLATIDGAPIEILGDSITTEGLSVGVHQLVWRVQDECGMIFTGTLEITVQDSTPPQVFVSLSENNLKAGDSTKANIVASDENGIASITAKLDENEVLVNDNAVALEKLTAGEHILKVTVTDKTGNYTEYTYTFTVLSNQEQDTTVPELDVEIEFDNDIIINAVATDDSGNVNITATVNGKEITLENGKAKYTPEGVGEYEIIVRAEDAAGNSVEKTQIVTITEEIIEHELRLGIKVDNTSLFVDEKAQIFVSTSSVLSDVYLTYKPSGGEIEKTEDGFSFYSEKAGVFDVLITATDDYGNKVSQTIIFTVKEHLNDNDDDDVDDENKDNPKISLSINEGLDTAAVNTDVSITAKATDSDGIRSLKVTVDGKIIDLDENGNSKYQFDTIGVYTIIATAEDTKGNITEKSAELKIIDSSDENCPDVEITSPQDSDGIAAPIEITGTVTNDGLLYYTLEYASVDEKDYTLISKGTKAVDDDVLGKLDTTLLMNGYYKIKLTAYSSKYNVSDEIIVSVEGQMKIGNYSIAFEDMSIPVVSFPLSVIRQYDSRQKNVSGDFGNGWDLNMTGMTISSSCLMGDKWYMDIESGEIDSGDVSAEYNVYHLRPKVTHEISVDWGNGRVDKFEMKITPDQQKFEPLRYDLSVNFKAKGNTKSKLEVINFDTENLIWVDNLLMDGDLNTFNPTKFKYTTEDGNVFIINTKTGVEKITDINGNTITFNKNGVVHSDGRSIVFTRDSKDRITKIVGPSDQTVTYSYDSNNDLTSVTDVSGYETKFVYDKNHYMTEIVDARGVKVARNEYDDDGRIIATIDADGNRMEFSHDVEGNREAVTDRLGNITLFVYDGRGNVVSKTDALGNTIKNTYDANGNLKSTLNATGTITKYEYDENGNLKSVTDALNNTVSNTYSENNRLLTISSANKEQLIVDYNLIGNITATTDAMGNVTDYDYDNKGQIKSVTDNIGVYMKFTYDSEGKVITSSNGNNETAYYTYDEEGNCKSKTIRNGSEEYTENYTYDIAGNVTSIIYHDGSITSVEYDAVGNAISSVDSSNRRTSYEYDLFGNLVKITYCDDTTETFEYDKEGRNTKATDRLGRMVNMTYDKVGNLLTKTYPNGSKEEYTFDANSQMISQKSINGGITTYEYDLLGRNTAIIDALGNKTKFTFNESSLIASMTDPNGNVYTYSYDDNGNRTKITMPNGESISTVYDARGRIVSQTDQNGYKTGYIYDAADRLISVIDAFDNQWTYTYNSVGDLTSVKDANENVTSYEYDSMGRVVKTINATGKVAKCTYDKSGNMLTLTDYAGTETKYTYDNLDRKIKQEIDDEITEYTYSVDGLISTVTDKSGVIKYTYDDMNGLTKVELADKTEINYSYNASLQLTKVSTTHGDTSYEYDLMDRLTRVVDRDGIVTVYEYDANGNRTAVKYANGITTTYTYNDVNHLIYEQSVDKDSNVMVKYAYTLGKSGERLKVAESGCTTEYTYDKLYRLTGEKVTKGEKVTQIAYTYDKVGNRLTKTENGKVTDYSYNNLNQLLSETGITYSYNANGNLIKKSESDQTTTYTFDKQNHLIRSTISKGQSVSVEEYEYDYAGNRTAKITEGKTTKYVVDTNGALSQVLYETDEKGNLRTFYTRGTDLISLQRPDEKFYYLYDGHGSVRGLIDEKGNVTDTYDYDAFGNLTGQTGTTENNYLYCGEQFDSNTGFYYLRARYMSPSTGTFISMDSYQGSMFDPVSLHKYLYANANPVMNSDPTGYFSLSELNCVQAIESALHQLLIPNFSNVLKWVNMMSTFLDACNQLSQFINNGGTIKDFALSLLNGAVSSLFLQFMCQFKAISYCFVIIGFGIEINGIDQALEDGDYFTAILRMIQLGTSTAGALTQSCFTGDTLVSTEDGQKRIDEIAIGDKVWSYNVETGETELQEVKHIFVKETYELLHLNTSEGDIDTTTNHPFYVIDKGWVAAGDLVVGDEVYNLDGTTAVITDYALEKLDEPITVYNLEINDFHTYFVGDEPVLVHNSCENTDLTRQQKRDVETLRSGKDVSVRNVEDARKLLNAMPEVNPPPLGRMDPTLPDIRGTYRGDLINKRNPTANFIHDPKTVLNNPNHARFPHYNIYFISGKKAAILISG